MQIIWGIFRHAAVIFRIPQRLEIYFKSICCWFDDIEEDAKLLQF